MKPLKKPPPRTKLDPNGYLQSIQRRYGNHTDIDNNALISELQRTKDPKQQKKIRDLIICHNIKLVMKTAFVYSSYGMEILDLIQEGVIGLMRAIDLYRPELGNQFSTYANWWIRQHISRFILDNMPIDPFRIPPATREAIFIVQKHTTKLFTELERVPTAEEIHQRILEQDTKTCKKMTLENIKTAQTCLTFQYVAVNEKFRGSSNKNPSGDHIPDTTHAYADSETWIDARFSYDEIQKKIEQIGKELDTLPLKDATVLRHRLRINGAKFMKLEELGQEFNVTGEAIRQWEKKGLRILKFRTGLNKQELKNLVELQEELLSIIFAQ